MSDAEMRPLLQKHTVTKENPEAFGMTGISKLVGCARNELNCIRDGLPPRWKDGKEQRLSEKLRLKLTQVLVKIEAGELVSKRARKAKIDRARRALPVGAKIALTRDGPKMVVDNGHYEVERMPPFLAAFEGATDGINQQGMDVQGPRGFRGNGSPMPAWMQRLKY